MAEVVNVEASIARLVELEEQMDSLEESYKKGKVSLDDYNKSLTQLEVESDRLSKSLLRQGADVDALVSKQRKLNAETATTNKQLKTGTNSYRSLGAAARTSFAMLSSSVATANPLLATCLGNIRAMTPAITTLGVSSATAGGLMKAAFSPAGLGVLIVAITALVSTLVKHFDDISSAIGLSSEKVDELKTKMGDVVRTVVGWLSGLGNVLLQSVLKPIQGVLKAVDIIKEDGVKGAKDAAKAIGNGFYEGSFFNTENNFKKGQEVGLKIVDGIKSKKDDVKDALSKVLDKAISDTYASSYNELMGLDFLDLDGLDSDIKAWNDKVKGWSDDNLKILGEWMARNDSEMDKEITAINLKAQEYIRAGVTETEALEWAESEKAKIRKKYRDKEEEEAEKAAKAAKERKEQEEEDRMSIAKTVSSSFKTISDVVSSNLELELESGKISEKEYKRKMKSAKALAKASIIADSAVAIMGAWKTAFKDDVGPTPVKLGLAAASSFAISAAAVKGIQSIDSESAGNVSSSSVQKATGTTQVYSVSSGEDADRITQAIQTGTSKAADSKVVLVVEDLNKVQNGMKKADVESSF